MANYYPGNFYCSNCGWSGVMEIEKGTTMNEAADNAECPNCGCETIHPQR